LGYFNNISLYNYRNFKNYNLNFSDKCNVLFGKNGSGKTNILESISLLSKGRGLRKDKLSNIVKKNCEKFIIKSDFTSDNIIYNLVSETVTTNNKYKKILKVNNDQSLEILQKIYNLAPFLYFLPETERLFQSSPSIRRRLIDQFIFTNQNSYNKLINKYTKLIQERSKLLLNNYNDESWLTQLEKNISINGLEIYSLRENQIKLLIDNLNIYLNEYNLRFKINVKLVDKYFIKNINQKDYENTLKNNRKIDTLIGGCNIGPHKSDYIFYVNDDYLVSQLSTGQQKTIILLMYLSQCKYLLECKDKKPILLFDEICSHLDEVNRNILLTLAESYNLQIFMTGTSKKLFSFLSTNTNFCNITD